MEDPVIIDYNTEKAENLNNLRIREEGGNGFGDRLRDNSVSSGKTTVLFRDIESALISLINNAEAVVGCVAWLTSKPILMALARKKLVSIVVQKEDFLRPDLGCREGASIRPYYKRIPERPDFDLFRILGLGDFSENCYHGSEPIRCVGNYNWERKKAFPRMHNKFVVFGTLYTEKKDGYKDHKFNPYSVWTGSFNFTQTAGYSLENAIISSDKKIVQAYYKEFQEILKIIELLDWKSEWVQPQFRLGS